MDVEATPFPRYVRYRGKKARVLEYTSRTEMSNACIRILCSDDTARTVLVSAVSFIKTKK